MPTYRCAYCRGVLGTYPRTRCPHCGRSMLLPRSVGTSKARRKQRRHEPADITYAAPGFRPGRSPAILGAIILVFIVLGTLLTSRMQAPRNQPTIEHDPVARALREVVVLRIALQRFAQDTGRYPSASEGLNALVQDPGVPGWAGHYVNLIQPDPWKTPYRYIPSPQEPDVRSAGPDRTFQTPDDISAQVSL